MVLIATVQQLQLMRACAEATYPEECCGLLLGTRVGEVKRVREVVATANSWDGEAAAAFGEALGLSPRETGREGNFAIAPETLLLVQRQARDRNLNIIGIYHSHPDSPAIPSDFDRAIAWPQYSYPIISVLQGRAEHLFSWALDETGNFQSEDLVTDK